MAILRMTVLQGGSFFALRSAGRRIRHRSGRAAILAAMVACGAMATACGRKEKPYAPEDVVPQKISDLTLFEEGEDVVLTWSVPKRNANGWTLKDLAGFKVLRKIEFAPYQPVGDVTFDEKTERETVKRIRYREHRPTRTDISADVAATLAKEVAKIREAEEASRKAAEESAAGGRTFTKKPSELDKVRNRVFYVVLSANESGHLSEDSNEVSFALPPETEKR